MSKTELLNKILIDIFNLDIPIFTEKNDMLHYGVPDGDNIIGLRKKG